MNKSLIISLLLTSFSFGQQTVGLFQYTTDAFPGYTLFAPSGSDNTWLIDNCGDAQYIWQSSYRPGASVDLLDDGTLIRACRFDNESQISAGGAGGRIEAIQLDQQIAWSFEYSNDSVRLHHDFELMDNGNILMIAWDAKTQQQVIDAGREPIITTANGLWPDHVIEYDPVNDEIVWRWNAWDHLVQEFDATKPNYGIVADHPELFNLNFDRGNGQPDWQHFNSIAYNEELDQIVLSSPFWNEVYIIDHSTSSLEAASHSGGEYGKGGDILWRWGNPEMYGAGDSTNQQLFFQHDAHWIPSGYRHENKLILYNNGQGRSPEEYSTVDIIAPLILSDGNYGMDASGNYFPDFPDYIYTAPSETTFFSHIVSSADMLPNGNIIIDEGSKGHFFEVDSSGVLVWDYVNPIVQNNNILAQEEPVNGQQALVFRARRIAHDYPGVMVLPMTNTGPIELQPYQSNCLTQLSLSKKEIKSLQVYPSPTSGALFVQNVDASMDYSICNSLGQVIISGTFNSHSINVNKLDSGTYFLMILDTNTGVNSTASFVKN